MKEFTVTQNDAGQRLDRYVGKTVPVMPSALVQKYIRIKRIKVCEKGSKRDYKLKPGETVQMYVNDEFFDTPNEHNAYLMVMNPDIDIVYEDENILLINKKVGILCHDGGKIEHTTLIAHIKAYLFLKGEWRPRSDSFSPALCNRIDRNTSGIVIAAKNADTLRTVNEKLKHREIDKYYLAAVHGEVTPASGRLNGYLFKDAVKKQSFVFSENRPGAKFASTEYRTVSKADELTLLECRLITGRTHQIRAQLASFGYPLLGDGKYGSNRMNKPFGEAYQALCSYKLVFSFKTQSGTLDYLNKRVFQLKNVDFAEKYFNNIDI